MNSLPLPICLLLFCLIGLFGGEGVVADVPPTSQDLVVGVSGLPPHLNPLLGAGHIFYLPSMQLFASPVRIGAEGEPQPWLARRWTISEDELHITLWLREDARFHDGQPIGAADLAWSLTALRKYHPFHSLYAPIKRLEVIDSHTLTIHLEHPHPALFIMLSPLFCPVMPEHVYGSDTPMREQPANLAPVGSGPFVLDEFTPAQSLRLRRNPDYFEAGLPYLDTITLKPISQRSDFALELRHGRIDMIELLYRGTPGFDEIEQLDGVVVTEHGIIQLAALTTIEFQTRQPPLDDLRVRKAIALALDPERYIRDSTTGVDQPAITLFQPQNPFYTDALPHYDQDIVAANKLLDEVGLVRDEKGRRFSLTIDYPPTGRSGRDFADLVAYELSRNLGIDVQVRHSPDLISHMMRIASGEYMLNLSVLFQWQDPIIGMHRSFLCSNIRPGVPYANTSGYCNARSDALLEQAARTTDMTLRISLYQEFQRVILEQLPVYPISWVALASIYSDQLTGLEQSLWGVFAPFDRVRWKSQDRSLLEEGSE